MYKFEAKFCAGNDVVYLNDIEAKVESVIFSREMIAPLYDIEWCVDGSVRVAKVHEADLKLADLK